MSTCLFPINFGAFKQKYKLNKNIKLPKPMSSNKELQCELRRTSYMKAFDSYKKNSGSSSSLQRKKAVDNVINGRKSGKKKMHKNTVKKDGRKKPGRLKGGGDKKESKHQPDPTNLSKEEIKALKSLKERVKQGDLIICQTDKSSRFAAMTRQQYMDSGLVHTSKDKEIDWKDVRYLQSQINSHVWWISNIVGYAEKTDPERMLKNIQNHSLEVPEMALLIKDHKNHDLDSNSPVPSRPVVSGNRGVNTHLSELLSEFLEPLIPDMGGGEVASTEEALYTITSVNEKINDKFDWNDLDILKDLSSSNGLQWKLHDDPEDMSLSTSIELDKSVGMDGMNKSGDPESPSNLSVNGPVGMDGMNKLLREGGGVLTSPQTLQLPILVLILHRTRIF